MYVRKFCIFRFFKKNRFLHKCHDCNTNQMISKDMYRSIARASAFSQYHHILYDICTHMVGKCVVGCHLCQDGPSVRAIHKQCIYNVLCLLLFLLVSSATSSSSISTYCSNECNHTHAALSLSLLETRANNDISACNFKLKPTMYRSSCLSSF